ncbi:MAG: glycosyltransferase family 2 protein [Clostridia bacterium]|nr:glycosyltransferase family 2 protein [Clostridia bacterium]
MPIISVVIPVYNVEKYLKRCIESVLRQTFHNFELILVDDGSSDKSGSICDEYASLDTRIKVLHKANGGVSNARNDGIDIATGKYLMFVDSDDYIKENMLETLVNKNPEDADMIISSIRMVCKNDTYEYVMKDGMHTPDKLLTEYCFEAFPKICLCGPWCKLYKTSLIKENCIKFDSNLSLGEDTAFNMLYVAKCKKIITISDIFYFYMRDNENSLFSKFRDNYYKDQKAVYELCDEVARELNCPDNAINALKNDYIKKMVYNLPQAVITADKSVCIGYMKKLSQDSLFVDNIELFKNRKSIFFLSLLIKNGRYGFVYNVLKMKYSLKELK